MTISIIIQARMGSTRLPGKVLADLDGRPLLAHVVDRARRIHPDAQVILATTTLPRDDPIVELGDSVDALVFRGDEDDVLDRYHEAVLRHGGDSVMRVTADCPLLDPAVSRRVLDRFLEGDADYVSNVRPNSFPDGLDTEVFSAKALEATWNEARTKSEREYVTQFIWSRPDRFQIRNLSQPVDRSHLRWTVDEPADLVFVRAVMAGLRRRGWDGMDHEEVLKVIDEDGIQDAASRHARNEGLLRSLRAEGRDEAEIERIMAMDRTSIAGRAP